MRMNEKKTYATVSHHNFNNVLRIERAAYISVLPVNVSSFL